MKTYHIYFKENQSWNRLGIPVCSNKKFIEELLHKKRKEFQNVEWLMLFHNGDPIEIPLII